MRVKDAVVVRKRRRGKNKDNDEGVIEEQEKRSIVVFIRLLQIVNRPKHDSE